MRRKGRLVIPLMAGLVLATAAPQAGAGTQAQDTEAKRQHWVERHETLRSQEKELREALEKTRVEYSRGRRANRLRGEGRAELIEEIEKLEKELAQAQRKLASFPEEARAAGALPGWFRDLDPASVPGS